jgi:APA family basic amino acid/polyamine antiporter
MYSFGATLSFTVAHASIVALRARHRDEDRVFRGRPNLTVAGVEWPLFALLGGLGTGIAFIVIVLQDQTTRWAGFGWLALGLVGFVVYRRSVLHEPLTATVRAPAMILGPSLTAEYRTIVVPVVRTAESEDAVIAAARLATERGSTVVVLHVLEVPMDRSLDAPMPALEEAADDLLDNAQAIVDEYGVRSVSRLVRARSAGRAIVDEAVARDAELIVLGAPRQELRGTAKIFGKTTDYVLRNSPTRVLVTAGRKQAA